MTVFCKGNEAVVHGALAAGCRAYFGYPITPASEIAHAAARRFPAAGGVFLQAECETASVQMMYGAAAAGALSMTATSGPGFSLMQDGLSFMAAAELPGVVVNVMRTGPGLGNVYPEQSDYLPAVKRGGHGAYRTIALAPASVQEMCDFTRLAFRLSADWRTPAIVLADGLQGQTMERLTVPETVDPAPDFSAWSAQGTAATRGALIKSIEIDQAGQRALNLRLQEKYARMQAIAQAETEACEEAEVVVTGYGISARLARAAMREARRRGWRVGFVRPITLSPFPGDQLAAAVRTARQVMAVALDDGAFADDVELALVRRDVARPVTRLGDFGGTLVTEERILSELERFFS